jgi:hypothetical protein
MPTGYPTYLQVNSNGTVTAIFTGGVQMPEADAPNPIVPVSALTWTDIITGTVREFIQGYFDTLFHSLFIGSKADTTDYAILTLSSEALGPVGSAGIFIQAEDNTTGVQQFINLFDSEGRTEFLRGYQSNVPASGSTMPISEPGYAVNTVYQPNTLHATLIILTLHFPIPAGNTWQAALSLSPTNIPANTVTLPLVSNSNVAAIQVDIPLTFLVPAGWYFKVTQLAGTPTIIDTFQYQL